MITAVVGIVILGLCFAVVIAVARDPGPGPAEVATSYELAWDHLDFPSLWVLAGPELRDGRDRAAYVAAKQAAYRATPALRDLAVHVTIEHEASRGNVAVVRTRVELADGGVVRNQLRLTRRHGRWQVVHYGLVADEDPALRSDR